MVGVCFFNQIDISSEFGGGREKKNARRKKSKCRWNFVEAFFDLATNSCCCTVQLLKKKLSLKDQKNPPQPGLWWCGSGEKLAGGFLTPDRGTTQLHQAGAPSRPHGPGPRPSLEHSALFLHPPPHLCAQLDPGVGWCRRCKGYLAIDRLKVATLFLLLLPL